MQKSSAIPSLSTMSTFMLHGPNDIFEISSNNSPDLPDDDDEVYYPWDHSGDYPLEGDDGEDE